MQKKVVKQKKEPSKNPLNQETLKILTENSVSLQKVVTNLAINLDGLSKQIEKLLSLFENSAKSVADRTIGTESDTRRILQKIDNLTEQNKVIAKSLTLMHEKDFSNSIQPMTQQIQQAQPSSPQQTQEQQPMQGGIDIRGYQKSISSK
jgi:hypothetical protein